MSNINEKYELLQHLNRVSELAYEMSKYMNLSEEESKEIAIAGHLHDIGKFFQHPSILNKKDPLTAEERSYVQHHVNLSFVASFFFQDKLSPTIVKLILEHHEDHDGGGYPQQLKGDEISLGAQILRICDVYDAMRSNRPYRKAMDGNAAIVNILKESHKYNPECIEALVKINKINICKNTVYGSPTRIAQYERSLI